MHMYMPAYIYIYIYERWARPKQFHCGFKAIVNKSRSFIVTFRRIAHQLLCTHTRAYMHKSDHFLFAGQCKFLFTACVRCTLARCVHFAHQRQAIGHTSYGLTRRFIAETNVIEKCIPFVFTLSRHGYGYGYEIWLLVTCHATNNFMP